MCILCVIQKWSRQVATMLPWLVIPLIGLWVLSQLLPPAFQFEITSPRLACVFVLLVTLFWYEILMPQLSAWRVRRNALLRERKRFEAIELQKLRKTATRRCRNCLTPYRDQNPGGSKFMCSYCGHISKRPVLDLPVPPGFGISNSGIIKDLVGKSGKILNGKVWSDNGWICGHDWLDNGNWIGDSIPENSAYWRKNGTGLFGDENCLEEKSYSSVVTFACKTCFILSIRWLWRNIFRVSSSREDASSDADHKGMLAKRGENVGNFHESRGEKARRKAEEKKQARLEKELLEEEERKQREEVARLVEERRRLRDEKMEAEKDCGKSLPTTKGKDRKKEGERKRQERRKDKDKGSSKSNSDVEELEKKTGKESERKRDFDKKSDIYHKSVTNNVKCQTTETGHEIKNNFDKKSDIYHKSVTNNVKCQTTETGHEIKNTSANNFSRGNAGTRYLDRMRGTFLSSSKAFSGGSFFGRGINTAAAMTKENKPKNSDYAHMAGHRRDLCPVDRVAVRPVHCEPQPSTAPKKSWQQLFTRSASVPPSSNSNVISRPSSKFQPEFQSPKFQPELQSPKSSGQATSIQSFDNPINFGLPSPFIISTYVNGSPSSSLGFSSAIEPIYPRVNEGSNELVQEEAELFEDPCYIPDPVSLIGSVSESLDNFQLDLGTGFGTDIGLKQPRTLKHVSASSDVNKPSPIESPMSREKHNSSGRSPTTHKTQDMHTSPVQSANEMGTWQMWHTCPLGHDGLGLVGGPASWRLPSECKDDFVHPSSQKTMASLFTKEEQVLSSTQTTKNIFLCNAQNGGAFSSVTGSSDPVPWLQKAFLPPVSSGENQFFPKAQEETNKNEMVYGPNRSSVILPFANSWSKSDWVMQDTGEGAGKLALGRPHVGGLFPTPDVQSLWSFE